MRILLSMCFLVPIALARAEGAEGVVKREPKVIPPGVTMYVDNGVCSPGKILKVTAAFKGPSRKKACVQLDPLHAARDSDEDDQ